MPNTMSPTVLLSQIFSSKIFKKKYFSILKIILTNFRGYIVLKYDQIIKIYIFSPFGYLKGLFLLLKPRNFLNVFFNGEKYLYKYFGTTFWKN